MIINIICLMDGIFTCFFRINDVKFLLTIILIRNLYFLSILYKFFKRICKGFVKFIMKFTIREKYIRIIIKIIYTL